MKKLFILAFLLLFFFLFLPMRAKAAETLIFDSTDHYLGGCKLTDKSEWELKNDLNVTTFKIWYNWDQGETELPVTIFKDGEKFAEFKVTRSECDPYQTTWCNGAYQINKLFPKGKYSTQIPNARQCLKPGGTGTILLFGSDTAPITSQATQPATKAEPVVCPSCTKTILITAIIAFLAGSVVSLTIFKKR